MDPDFWHQRWQTEQIGFHQDRVNEYLVTYWQRLNAQRNDRVFVPLCGKSKDMLWLSGQGYSVVGVELSSIAVDAFFAENELVASESTVNNIVQKTSDSIDVYCGDFFALTAEHMAQVSYVFDRAALVALPPTLRRQYVQHLQTVLPDLSQVLLVTVEYPQHEMKGPPFAVLEDEVHALFNANFAIEHLISVDVLVEQAHFKEKGLTELRESVYLLSKS